ncbi:hypothetical protein A3K73_04765 [Candidatus Pacearchaeota archaeon RBG_13_36_9]|nr:MAG: hypothetical protein A3K73_04765 [Candidatus Pacearchaeota archaeon RBG_13_36_9]
MIEETEIKKEIASLLKKYESLSSKGEESEKKAEEFLSGLFEKLGWDRLSGEVTPQKKIKGATKTTRVDFSFKKEGDIRPSFYLEVKRFSDMLQNPDHIVQAIGYGKNSGIRWVVLTNFIRWRVFNSDYFDEPEHAELFEFDLNECLSSTEAINWLILFCHEKGGAALDEYAKKHKKWKESADIEELLTEQLLIARKKLGIAIKEQNLPKFDTGQDMEESIDYCVQTILDRIIFCRMLEDNGVDQERKISNVLERWKNGDNRIQFYKDYLCPFFIKEMHERYDSTIFDHDRVDRLSIKNEDFIPILESFYVHPKTNLRYRFDAISADILGHAYENYLSYKVTAKKKGLEEERYKRKQSGIYYTPEFLVDYLVKSTLGELLKRCKSSAEALKIRVLDPACGSGTFLVRAFDEFKSWFMRHEREGKEKELLQAQLDFQSETKITNFLSQVLENCLYGIDLDPRAVRLSRLNLFLRALDTPKQLPKLNIIERNSLVWDGDDSKAFNIERDFPLVTEAGGFDVVIGNPPWEKWKIDSQEFFEPFEPGFKSLPTQEAKKRIAEILKTRPLIKKLWIEKQANYELYSTIFRKNYQWQSSKVNGKKVSGDLDLYKIFTERAYQLAKIGGVTGFVIPSGVYTDLGAKGLRTMLFDNCSVRALYSFENKSHGIFPDVHASYKFVLLTFEKGGRTKSFPCAFFLHSAEELKKAIANPTIMNIDFVKKSSPTSWSVLEIKSKKDYEIVQKLLKFPPLGEKREKEWNIEMQSGFHMTNDSHLFQEGKLTGVPMLEGKNIEQFTHRWKEAPIPRYKIFEKDIESALKPEKRYYKSYWMAYRLIASSTNYRTLISTIVPPGYVGGNSLAIIRMDNNKQLCFLAGIINSFVIDYFIRQKVSANVNMFYFLETPVPRLSSGKEFEAVVRKVAQLVSVTNEFQELKKEIGIEYPLTNENERALARAQLDIMVAKIYGITKEELAFILDKFPLVDRAQKELVLSQY